MVGDHIGRLAEGLGIVSTNANVTSQPLDSLNAPEQKITHDNSHLYDRSHWQHPARAPKGRF